MSFDVADGEIFGLIGPNGAGKTTTMECVEGLRSPDRGTISVLGLDPFRDVYKLQNLVGQLPPHLREVVVLHVVANLPGNEVAAMLGISLRTVWTRLHRARVALHNLLGDA